MSPMTVFAVIGMFYYWLNVVLALCVAGLGAFGAITASTTRPDAFMVIDRQKQNWILLCAGAAVAGLLSAASPNLLILWVIGAVIVGIYWQDVRPAIRDVLDNASGSW